MRRSYGVLVVFVSIVCGVGCAEGVPGESDRLADLETRTGQRWRGVFDPELATASALARTGAAPDERAARSALTPTLLLQVAPDVARRFVAEQPELFGRAAAEPSALLALDVARASDGGARVRLGLRVDDLPVDGGEAIVVLD